MVKIHLGLPISKLVLFLFLIQSFLDDALLPSVKAYRFAWRPTNKVFPYEEVPPPSYIDNGDNNGKLLQDFINRKKQITAAQDCVVAWKGDGKCNIDNNKQICSWDEGDCCAYSCMVNCNEIDPITLEKNMTTFNITRKIDRPCPFECGVLDFDCREALTPNRACYKCNTSNSINAYCQSQPDCFTNPDVNYPDEWHLKVTDDNYKDWYKIVLENLDKCQAYSWSMGNMRTIDPYCGQDLDNSTVHDINDPLAHFPGCGLPEEVCTRRPCCTDAAIGSVGVYGYPDMVLNSTTCDSKERKYNFWDPKTFARLETLANCTKHFYDCFQENARVQGQCCQCKEGWTGIDCNQAVCFPNREKKLFSGCVHGYCVAKDTCICNPGWKGDQCDIGICDNCVNGKCIGPGECDCFYGWRNVNCTEGISYPACMHGIAIRPDFCQCDDGWIGRVCDQPNCTYGCGSGYCKDSETCECFPGYFSSNTTHQCDNLICSEVDPQCETCSTRGEDSYDDHGWKCDTCKYGYFLKQDKQSCGRCDLALDHCYECQSVGYLTNDAGLVQGEDLECIKCEYPYFSNKTFRCVHHGIFEVAQDVILVDESQLTFDIRINRLYHNYFDDTMFDEHLENQNIWDPYNFDGYQHPVIVEDNIVQIDYELSPAYASRFEKDLRIEQKRGTLYWNINDKERYIFFKIYKRQYFEENADLTKFYFNMKFCVGGQMAHDAKQTIIYYYDGRHESTDMNDAQYSYVMYMDQFRNNAQKFTNVIGRKGYFFTLYSYYREDSPKNVLTDGNGYQTNLDMFFMRLMVYNPEFGRWTQQSTPFPSEHLSGNKYNISYFIQDQYVSEMRFYATCRGFKIKYFPIIEDEDNYPILTRIEPELPGKFPTQYKWMAYFTTHFEFMFDVKHLFNQDQNRPGGCQQNGHQTNCYKEKQDLTVYVAINSAAFVTVYLDGNIVIEMPDNEREKTTVACNRSIDGDMYYQYNMFTFQSNIETSCCFGADNMCIDIGTAPDQQGKTCEWYKTNQWACGQYDVDLIDNTESSFFANQICCACGGGEMTTKRHLWSFNLPATDDVKDDILQYSGYHHILVEYNGRNGLADVQFNQDPCFKMFFEGTQNKDYWSGIEFQEFSVQNSFAPTEVRESPFKPTIEIDTTLIDLLQITVTMEPWTDPNTNITYTHMDNRTFGVGQNHIFTFAFYDIYGNYIDGIVNLDPPYFIEYYDDTSGGLVDQVGYSYVNLLSKSQQYNIIVMKSIVNTTDYFNHATLAVTFMSNHIIKSPFEYWHVLPGLFNFTNSFIREYNLKSSYLTSPNPMKPWRCYINDICTFEITLRDSYCNLMNRNKGLLKTDEHSVVILGPYDNEFGDTFEPSMRYAQNVTQWEDKRKELYHVNLSLDKVGVYMIYMRLKRSGFKEILYPHPDYYPINITTYSDRVDNHYSESTLHYYYVGKITIVYLARDKTMNILTDQGVLFNATVTYHDYGENPEEILWHENPTQYDVPFVHWAKPETYIEYGNSTYQLEMYPEKRGWWALTSQVCMKLENECNLAEYTNLTYSPQYIYFHTQFPDPYASEAFGSGIYYSIIMKLEVFYVQIKDKFDNWFDIYYDDLHQQVAPQDFIQCTLLIEEDSGNVIEYPINLRGLDRFNGRFAFDYIVREPFIGTMFIYIKVLHSTPYYNEAVLTGLYTEEELKNIDYTQFGDDRFVNIPGSPFVVFSAQADVNLYETYADLLQAGLGHSVYSTIEQRVFTDIAANQEFTIQLNTLDVFSQRIVTSNLDPQYTDPNQLIMIDFHNHQDEQCIAGSDHSRLKRYCQHFSHSMQRCFDNKICRWVPENKRTFNDTEVLLAKGFSHFSCQPCQNTIVPSDSTKDISKIQITHDGPEIPILEAKYYVHTQIKRAGNYSVMGALLTQSSPILILFNNPDFTDNVMYRRITAPADMVDIIGGLQQIFNSTYFTNTNFFDEKYGMWSAVIQGAIRAEYSVWYNYTIESNLKYELYFDGELVLAKDNLQQTSESTFNRLMEANQIVDLELYLVDDSLYQETKIFTNRTRSLENKFDFREAKVDRFVKMMEQSPYHQNRPIMPKNMYHVSTFKNTNMTHFMIHEDISSVQHCKFSANYTSGTQFRAGQRLMYNVTLFDQYDNIRKNTQFSSEDTVTANVYIDGVNSSYHELTPQILAEGHGYYFIYHTSLVSWDYDVFLFVNGDRFIPNDIHQFKFSVNFTNIDVVQSSLSFLGYHHQNTDSQPLDCIFVNNDIFAIIDMKDKYGNDVKIDQYAYWGDLVKIYFDGGSGFQTIHCVPYTGIENSQWYEDVEPAMYERYNNTLVTTPSDHIVICPLKPSSMSYFQTLHATDSNDDQSFSPNPLLNVEVKPYKVKNININDASHFQISFEGTDTSPSSSKIEMRINMIDVYGNQIGMKSGFEGDMSICNYFEHDRLILYTYFNNLDGGQDTLYDISNQDFSVSSQFDTQGPDLIFEISLDKLYTSSDFFSKVGFNFVLLEGLDIQNGFLVKYFSDEAFQGTKTKHGNHTPNFAEIQKNLEFDQDLDAQYQDLWSKSFYTFKKLSIRTTALIRAPSSVSEAVTFSIDPPPPPQFDSSLPPGIHKENTTIDVYIDDVLVISNGTSSGVIQLQGAGTRWYNLEILHSIDNNYVTSTSEVPQFRINWESASTPMEVLDYRNSLAVDVKDTFSWSDGTKLRQNNYKFN